MHVIFQVIFPFPMLTPESTSNFRALWFTWINIKGLINLLKQVKGTSTIYPRKATIDSTDSTVLTQKGPLYGASCESSDVKETGDPKSEREGEKLFLSAIVIFSKKPGFEGGGEKHKKNKDVILTYFVKKKIHFYHVHSFNIMTTSCISIPIFVYINKTKNNYIYGVKLCHHQNPSRKTMCTILS